MFPENFVQVGVVAGTDGWMGSLKVKPTTDNPSRFQVGTVLYVNREPYTVEEVIEKRGHMVLKLLEIDSIDKARGVMNSLLEVPESEVPCAPPDTYYHFQLIDSWVYDMGGRFLGVVHEVLSTGANDVYAIRYENTELLVPAIEGVVLSVDVNGHRIIVDIPDGLEPRTISTNRKSLRKQQTM